MVSFPSSTVVVVVVVASCPFCPSCFLCYLDIPLSASAAGLQDVGEELGGRYSGMEGGRAPSGNVDGGAEDSLGQSHAAQICTTG